MNKMKNCIFKRIKKIKHRAFDQGYILGSTETENANLDYIVHLRRQIRNMIYAKKENQKCKYTLSTCDGFNENIISKSIEKLLTEMIKGGFLDDRKYKITTQIVHKDCSSTGQVKYIRLFVKVY